MKLPRAIATVILIGLPVLAWFIWGTWYIISGQAGVWGSYSGFVSVLATTGAIFAVLFATAAQDFVEAVKVVLKELGTRKKNKTVLKKEATAKNNGKPSTF